jgi:hypothetical protein
MASPLDILLGNRKSAPVAGAQNGTAPQVPQAQPTGDLRRSVDPTFTRSPRTVTKFAGVASGDVAGRVADSRSNHEAEAEIGNILIQYGFRGAPIRRPEQALGVVGADQVKKIRGY